MVNKACEVGPAKAHHILTKLVGGLSEEELKLCLEYIRDWNTNSRHCAVAQAMLQAILVKHRPQVSYVTWTSGYKLIPAVTCVVMRLV